MTDKEWLELILEHEEEIREKICEAYTSAGGEKQDGSMAYRVYMYEGGALSVSLWQRNTWPEAAYKGHSISLFEEKLYDLYDEWNEDPGNYLTDEQNADFRTWCEEHDVSYMPYNIYQWNRELGQEARDLYEKAYFQYYSDDAVDTAWEQLVDEYKTSARYED